MLEVNARKSLGRFTLDVRFEHREGILILFGRSGAGKTTTLRMIAGIEKPTGGEIRFGGRKVYSKNDRVNVAIRDRGIGFIFQHHNLFPHMTAFGNIAYAATDHGEISQWLERFHIAHVADRYPAQLSGGEQQRVAIIRALMTRPRMLLMDEPLSAVDVATRNVLQRELREVQRSSGIPIIHVTHNVSEAISLGDRVLVLEEGRVIHDGLPIEIFHAPTSIPLASLSGTENIVDGIVAAHHKDDNTTELRVGDCLLHMPQCRENVGARAAVAIRPEDILIALRETHDTSARNQFRGRIVEIVQDTLPSIVVKIPGGPKLRAVVTRRSLESLSLTQGAEVYLLIKAWACHPIDPDTSP